MSEAKLKEIADNADIIVAGFAFTAAKNGSIRVLNLKSTEEACVLDADGCMMETTMDDSVLCLVQAYYMKNKEFIGT